MFLNFIVYNISRLQKNRYLSDLPLLTYRCIDQGVKHAVFNQKIPRSSIFKPLQITLGWY